MNQGIPLCLSIVRQGLTVKVCHTALLFAYKGLGHVGVSFSATGGHPKGFIASLLEAFPTEYAKPWPSNSKRGRPLQGPRNELGIHGVTVPPVDRCMRSNVGFEVVERG